jgi:hypothetical protein
MTIFTAYFKWRKDKFDEFNNFKKINDIDYETQEHKNHFIEKILIASIMFDIPIYEIDDIKYIQRNILLVERLMNHCKFTYDKAVLVSQIIFSTWLCKDILERNDNKRLKKIVEDHDDKITEIFKEMTPVIDGVLVSVKFLIKGQITMMCKELNEKNQIPCSEIFSKEQVISIMMMKTQLNEWCEYPGGDDNALYPKGIPILFSVKDGVPYMEIIRERYNESLLDVKPDNRTIVFEFIRDFIHHLIKMKNDGKNEFPLIDLIPPLIKNNYQANINARGISGTQQRLYVYLDKIIQGLKLEHRNDDVVYVVMPP